LFPAADEDQWSLIKKVIDECDYYIVISAGRYGTLASSGQSYTEMDYRYAVEVGKPVIAFLHKDLLRLAAASVEQTDDGRRKLTSFRELLQQKMCKYWETPAELGSVVSRSLVRLTKTKPAVGWIRADEATEALAAPEVLRLRKRIEELESRLEEARASAPVGSEKLAHGDDQYAVDFAFATTDAKGQDWTWNYQFDISWDELLYDIGPLMINEATDVQIRHALNQTVRHRSRPKRDEDKPLKDHKRARSFEISDDDFQTIKIQLRALGLISKSQRPRSIKDTETYWTLTPYGDQVLTTLRAIPKDRQASDGSASSAEDEQAGR
jgi:hypothetical protein